MLRIARMAGLEKLHRSDWRAGQSPLWAGPAKYHRCHANDAAMHPKSARGRYAESPYETGFSMLLMARSISSLLTFQAMATTVALQGCNHLVTLSEWNTDCGRRTKHHTEFSGLPRRGNDIGGHRGHLGLVQPTLYAREFSGSNRGDDRGGNACHLHYVHR